VITRMNDSLDSKCEHLVTPNGIYEFIFKEWGMSGADAFMTQLDYLYQSYTATDKPLPIVVINGSGALPINYSLQRGKELLSKYPNIGMIRIAVISDSAFEARLVDSFMRLMRFPGIRLRFFDAARRADANKWLLEPPSL
jgi:hypothetical protein